MKTILCFGDSHTRGNIPGGFDLKTGLSARYDRNKRWPGILQQELGPQFHVIEEGIGGRTTNLDELIPGRLYRNGLVQLPVSLEAHYPIDLVILMFGTNDLKKQFKRSVDDISNGMRELVKYVRASNKGPAGGAPQAFVVAPAPIVKSGDLHAEFDERAIKMSHELIESYRQMAEEEQCYFMDSSQIVKASVVDGVHLDELQCFLLGQAIAQKIRTFSHT